MSKGGTTRAFQWYFVWMIFLSIGVFILIGVALEKKENYTSLHRRVNQIERTLGVQ